MTYYASEPIKPPLGITIVLSYFVFQLTVLILVFLYSLSQASIHPIWFLSVIGVLVISVLIVKGIWERSPGAWYAILAVQSLSLLYGWYQILDPSVGVTSRAVGLFLAFISIAIIYYLLKSNSRQWFKIE